VEIHEEIAQSLGAIKMNMEASLPVNTQASAPGAQVMLPIIERIKEAIDLVRRLTKRLSPIMLDDLGIKTAIAALCRQAMETCNCGQIITRIDVDESRIPGELKIVIYRVLEELLTLSANYGYKKDHCAVSLDTCGGNIILAVEETGPHPAQRAGKYGQDMGMAVVKSRAESFGGALMIESGAENKHTITVSWPLDKKEQGSEE
jgi:two-component system sensor histidine kinase UhpB